MAVALLLGTTPDSPLLGTLYGSSPAPLATSSLAQANQLPSLACHRIKVKFRDEPGKGNGVTRSFMTDFTEAVLSQDHLPPLTTLLQPWALPAASLAASSGVFPF